MSKTRWSRDAGLGVLLASAGCMPLEELSSYGSGPTPAFGKAPSGSGDAGLIERGAAPAPVPDAGVAAAAPLDAGAPLAAEPAAPEPLAGSPSAVGSRPDAGAIVAAPPDALVGQSRQALDVAGLERSFIYYAPPDLDPSSPVPVLIVAHGAGASAEVMAAITGYDAIADREGFVVLYPEGQGAIPWNVGSEVCASASQAAASAGADDVAFIDAMLAFVAAERRVDREHVFMSGFGSGAALAHDVACRGSAVRAIAAHSGGSHGLQGCDAAPKPVLVLHGSEDESVPPTCGVQARNRWLEHNGCSSGVNTVEVRGGLCDVSQGCPVDGAVAICAFFGMGSGWAGGAAQASSYIDFASASELSWRFFERYAW